VGGAGYCWAGFGHPAVISKKTRGSSTRTGNGRERWRTLAQVQQFSTFVRRSGAIWKRWSSSIVRQKRNFSGRVSNVVKDGRRFRRVIRLPSKQSPPVPISVGIISIGTRSPVRVATTPIPVAIIGSTQNWIAKIRGGPDHSVACRAMIARTGAAREPMAFSLEPTTANGIGGLLDGLTVGGFGCLCDGLTAGGICSLDSLL
jgi:hypothetical protein